MEKRTIKTTGTEISAIGLGCWAIGGGELFTDIDDAESIRALHAAVDMGVNLLDTAQGYGPDGHSESVIGRAFKGRRDDIVLCTKFAGCDTEADIRKALEGSLRRLGTDYLDIYLCREGAYKKEGHQDLFNAALQKFQDEGKIRTYGISSDSSVENLQHHVENAQPDVCEIPFNIIKRSDAPLAYAEEQGLIALNKSPLGMGMLTGKFNADTVFSEGDLRGTGYEWLEEYFIDGKPRADFLGKMESIREILTSNGRTLVQGSLAWLLGRSSFNVPIPGFKSVKQVTENCGALEFGPLTSEQMDEIDRIL